MIKMYYIGVPVCLALQTVELAWIALQLTRIATRKWTRRGRKQN